MVLSDHAVGTADTDHGSAAPTVEVLHLSGRPSLAGFVRFVQSRALDATSKGALVDEWQNARLVIEQLARDEAGLAENPPILPLGQRYEALLLDFFRDPLVRHHFNALPTDVALVPLDRLVVFQKDIDVTFASALRDRLGSDPDEERVFRTSLPFDHPRPPATWSNSGRGRFVFVSPSNDLRFLGPLPLEERNLVDYAPPGALVGVVGLAVGFGTNFMNAIRFRNRLILNNGSHRAYALRASGVTHAPCIIQHASSQEELDLVASSAFRRAPPLLLEHRRPPLLRDYFDPRIFKLVRARQRLHQVTVRFEVEETFVPAL